MTREITLEQAAEKMDETCLGQAISGIRSLNITLYAEFERMKKLDVLEQQRGTISAGESE